MPQLLAAERGVRNIAAPPQLTLSQIQELIREHFERTGEWPHQLSGSVANLDGESWYMIDRALKTGTRGLVGESSLSRLTAELFGVNKATLRWSPFTIRQILCWADEYFAKTGKWPRRHSGIIDGTQGTTWTAVDLALKRGHRGLPGGSSLSDLLRTERTYVGRPPKEALDDATILSWADAHFAARGRWPTRTSGPVLGVPGEDWGAIDKALGRAGRGLTGKRSLKELLESERDIHERILLPRYSTALISKWIISHRQRTGRWPGNESGAIPEAPGQTWAKVNYALKHGRRGLPGGMTLARLIVKVHGARLHAKNLPQLSESQIIIWAMNFRSRHGHWPYVRSGTIPEDPAENWVKMDAALRLGLRGLPGGSSLRKLLKRVSVPPLMGRKMPGA